MPEYLVLAIVSAVAVVVYELRWAKTGIFRSSPYWITMAICLGFMFIVDGFLTRAGDPIVSYAVEHTSGWRFPWNIPVEDYLFGFALLTLVIVRWDMYGERRRQHGERQPPVRSGAG